MALHPRDVTADAVLATFENLTDFGQTVIKLLVVVEAALAEVLAAKLATTVSELPKLNFFILASLALAGEGRSALRSEVLDLSRIRNQAAHQLGPDVAFEAVQTWMQKYQSYLKWPRQRGLRLRQFHLAVAMMVLRINAEGKTGIFKFVPDSPATSLSYDILQTRAELARRHKRAVRVLLTRALQHLESIDSAVGDVRSALDTNARAAHRLMSRAADAETTNVGKRIKRLADGVAESFERLIPAMEAEWLNYDKLRFEWKLRNHVTWRAAQPFLSRLEQICDRLHRYVDEDGYPTHSWSELLCKEDKDFVARLRTELADLSLEPRDVKADRAYVTAGDAYAMNTHVTMIALAASRIRSDALERHDGPERGDDDEVPF
jgi:hypothetical protein